MKNLWREVSLVSDRRNELISTHRIFIYRVDNRKDVAFSNWWFGLEYETGSVCSGDIVLTIKGIGNISIKKHHKGH